MKLSNIFKCDGKRKDILTDNTENSYNSILIDEIINLLKKCIIGCVFNYCESYYLEIN
jgi:hypothetical protein